MSTISTTIIVFTNKWLMNWLRQQLIDAKARGTESAFFRVMLARLAAR